MLSSYDDVREELRRIPGVVEVGSCCGRPWMITRQWQMGEFIGDDAASPIDVKVHLETTTLQKYQPAVGPVEPFDTEIPLEAHVERRAISFAAEEHELALDIRLLMGRQWLKMIAAVSAAPAVAEQFTDRYPIHSPDPTDLADAPTCAHPAAWSAFAAAATRRMDGAKLYAHLLASPANHAGDGIAALAGMNAAVDPVATRFVRWFQRLFYQPDGPGAWLPERLEYQFAASAPHGATEKVLVAEEYFHGHLDWYNFDVDPERTTLGDPDPAAVAPKPHTLAMLPTSATFNGMPHSRWWRFEDSRTNFGDIRPDTTDLAKLLLIEFGLVFANDWFVVPFTVPAGTIAEVRGIAVTDVFGRRTWVEAAGRGADDDWQRWAMFLMSTRGKDRGPADLSLLLPPAARQVMGAGRWRRSCSPGTRWRTWCGQWSEPSPCPPANRRAGRRPRPRPERSSSATWNARLAGRLRRPRPPRAPRSATR